MGQISTPIPGSTVVLPGKDCAIVRLFTRAQRVALGSKHHMLGALAGDEWRSRDGSTLTIPLTTPTNSAPEGLGMQGRSCFRGEREAEHPKHSLATLSATLTRMTGGEGKLCLPCLSSRVMRTLLSSARGRVDDVGWMLSSSFEGPR
nr:hypothetical protein CFP56_03723 [Quercus suber]